MLQLYKNHSAIKPDRELSWGQLFDLIRIHNHRSFVKLRNPSDRWNPSPNIFWEKEKRELKGELPVFFPNAILDGVGTSKENIKELTSYLFFDIDKVFYSEDELNNAKECLFAVPYVRAVWVSPSGTGVHLIVSANPKHLTLENYEGAWVYIKDKLIADSGLTEGWDDNVKNANRKAYISTDPHLKVKDIVEDIAIPSNVRTVRKRTQRAISSNPRESNSTLEYDRLHSKIILPNQDFMTRLVAENMSLDDSIPIWSLDMSEQVGIGYEHPLLVPNLYLYMGVIRSGKRNYALTNHISHFLYLNHPYIQDEGMIKIAKALHSRVEQTDEYITPEPIYELLWKLYSTFDPSRPNQSNMRRKTVFYNAKATASGAERSKLSRLNSGALKDIATSEMAIKQNLDSIDKIASDDFYPSRAKITITTLFEFESAVQEKKGMKKDGKSLSTFYALCSNSELIKAKLNTVNENRPFTYEAGKRWENIERYAETNPHVHIADILERYEVPRSTYFRHKSQ